MLTAYRVSDEMRKGTENRKVSVGNSMRESYPVGIQVCIHHEIELLTNQYIPIEMSKVFEKIINL